MLITLYGPLYVPSSIRYRYHDRSEAESRSLKRRVSEERNCYLDPTQKQGQEKKDKFHVFIEELLAELLNPF
jgi:hypothetical protein